MIKVTKTYHCSFCKNTQTAEENEILPTGWFTYRDDLICDEHAVLIALDSKEYLKRCEKVECNGCALREFCQLKVADHEIY